MTFAAEGGGSRPEGMMNADWSAMRQIETEVVEKMLSAEGRARSDAWVQIQKMFEPLVRAEIGRRADKSQVDDLVQETFMAAFTSMDKSFDANHPETFGAWLRQVARNKVIDESRRVHGRKGSSSYGRRSAVSLDELSLDGEPPVMLRTIETPEDLMATEEQRMQFFMVMRGLNDRERRVVIMKSILGLTLKDIGRVFGFSESRASQIYNPAVERMKERQKRSPIGAGAAPFSEEVFNALVEEVRQQAGNVLGPEVMEAAAAK